MKTEIFPRYQQREEDCGDGDDDEDKNNFFFLHARSLTHTKRKTSESALFKHQS